MNILKIIKEEVDSFDWIRDIKTNNTIAEEIYDKLNWIRRPKLPTDNLQARFDLFPWAENTDAELKAWQRGNTGYPLVDAGMRELYNTGYMHNRVRMVVGSFLVKNLLVHSDEYRHPAYQTFHFG